MQAKDSHSVELSTETPTIQGVNNEPNTFVRSEPPPHTPLVEASSTQPPRSPTPPSSLLLCAVLPCGVVADEDDGYGLLEYSELQEREG